MWHIYKSNNKFDFVFVRNGRRICGSSPQGYNRLSFALKEMFIVGGGSLIRSYDVICFQDDTGKKSKVMDLYISEETGKLEAIETGLKPKKKYIPNKK